MDEVQKEMPRYRHKKRVHALQIKRIYVGRNGYTYFEPVEEGFADIKLDGQFLLKHDPHPGDFYVVSEFGHKSTYSPIAFKNGYSPVDAKEDS